LPKRYEINEHFFDNIDSENKAYWMGFIWCDGYCIKRIRDQGKIEYSFKLSLQELDKNHLEKFKNDIESNYDIKTYVLKSSFDNAQREARFTIGNQYLGKLLQEKYGLISHRSDPSKVCNEIPKIFYKDFIRGILDADGSFSKYFTLKEKRSKCNVTFSTYQNLVLWILNILKEVNTIENTDRKLYRRNKDRDGECRALTFSGRNQSIKVLDYLYKDSNIYLDRKYEKYLKIREEINNEL